MPDKPPNDSERLHIPKPPRPDASDDSKAQHEHAALILGLDLEEKETERRLNKATRQEQVDKHSHRIFLVFLYAIAAFVLFGLFSIGWHMFLPEGRFYLTEAQLTDIKQLLFSGAVGGIASTIARKHLLRD